MARRGLHIAMWIGGLALLGAMAWGVGWGAHALLDRWGALPAGMAETTASPMITATPVTPPAVASLLPTVKPPTSTPYPTSTLMPTHTPVPRVIVQAGEGLYAVCRRHCPGRWPGDSVPPELDRYAHEVARINGIRWPRRGEPRLEVNQELTMPPCPP